MRIVVTCALGAFVGCSGPQVAELEPESAEGSSPSEIEPAALPNADAAAVAVDPSDWLDGIADGRALPVFELNGTRWLQLEEVVNYEHPAIEPGTIPEEWYVADAPGSTLAPPNPVADYVSVAMIGPDGACTAALGPQVLIDRAGCSYNAAFAQEIIGCEGAVPIAWVDGAPPVDVSYVPVDFVDQWPWLENDAEVPSLRSAAPFSLLAAYESEFLTELIEVGVRADNFESAATMGWAFAGSEVVSVLMAGAHTLDTPECEDYASTYVTVGFEVEEGWRTVADNFVLSGILARDGEVVALVSGRSRELSVMARREKYIFEEVLDLWFWDENAECVDPWTPVTFAFDCAP